MSITTQLTHSAEAWSHLKGLVSLYKPAGYPAHALVKLLKVRLAEELNCMRRSVEDDTSLLDAGGGGGELVTSPESDVMRQEEGRKVMDYSSHPAVLGPGYSWEDIRTMIVNPLGVKSSGVLLVGLNRVGVGQAQEVRGGRLMRTYHVRGELGRATNTGWEGGKTVMCQGWTNLATRPWMMQQMLANISGANQARAWNVGQVGLDTQEGYELAVKGPVRPKLLSETIVYNIKLKEFKPPMFMLELHCIESQSDKSQEHLVQLVQEVALKCKTVCHLHSIRCGALGPWTAASSLLSRQFTLQDVLHNISDNRKIYRENISKPGVSFNPNIQEKSESRRHKINNRNKMSEEIDSSL